MTLRRPERAYRAFATKSGVWGWGQSGKALRVASSVCASPSKGADHEEGGLERRLRRSASKDRSLLPEKPESCRRYTSCIIGRTPAAGKCSWSHLARIMGQGCSTLKVLTQMVMSNPLSLIRSSVSADASPQYATALSRVRRSAGRPATSRLKGL